MTDFLDKKRKEIAARLAELKPIAEEYRTLEAASQALARVNGASTGTKESPTTPAAADRKQTRRRGPGRPRGSKSRAAKPAAVASTEASSSEPAERAVRRRGPRKGSGLRGIEALSFIQGQPGITIPELAGKMGIKQNYLYRVLPGLEAEGSVKKDGRGWHPAKQKTTS